MAVTKGKSLKRDCRWTVAASKYTHFVRAGSALAAYIAAERKKQKMTFRYVAFPLPCSALKPRPWLLARFSDFDARYYGPSLTGVLFFFFLF